MPYLCGNVNLPGRAACAVTAKPTHNKGTGACDVAERRGVATQTAIIVCHRTCCSALVNLTWHAMAKME